MKRIVVLLAALAAGLTALGAVMVALEIPEGMPWSYRVRDGDFGLTRIARRALPLVRAVDVFRAERGTCPNSRDAGDSAAIAARLPADARTSAAAGIGAPDYFPARDDPTVCTVAIRISHDEALNRMSDGAQAWWVYDPGDGGATVAVDLSP